MAFSSRARQYIHWQMMDNEMKKVQQAHEKARKQGRIPQDRVASSLSEVAEVCCLLKRFVYMCVYEIYAVSDSD